MNPALALVVFLAQTPPKLPIAPPTTMVSPELAPPADLRAAPCGSSVVLTWRDVSSAETGFVVLRRAAGAAHAQELALLPAGAASYTDIAVPDGDYHYRVRARGARGDSPPSNPVGVHFPNQPPVITTDLPADLRAALDPEPSFTVTVTDPEGDRVSLRLLDPPPGLIFDPLHLEPSPASVTARWLPGRYDEYLEHLVFESDCGVRLTRRVVHPAESGVLVGDVTGDGILDLVASAERTGIADTGAIHVFAGASTPAAAPAASLKVAGDSLRSRMNDRSLVLLDDVTGDGVLDVVSGSLSQTVYVWSGGAGLAGTPAPSAVLTPVGSSPADDHIYDSGQRLQLVDLDGDGTSDVFQLDARADVAGVADVGAVCLWLGGPGLSGTVAPTRVLSAPGAAAGDSLGYRGGMLVADATGDGVPDVLAPSLLADVGATSDVGAVYLWSGAAVLGGTGAPLARLVVPGFPGGVDVCSLADLSGDGVLDVISGAEDLAFGATVENGMYHVWNGGALAGDVTPSATLRIPGPMLLGSSFAGAVEVTGDGVLDFVTVSPQAGVFGRTSNGAIHVWAGGALSGTPAPTATLWVPSSTSQDLLGFVFFNEALTQDELPRNGARFVDVSGDGVLDVVSASLYADVAGTVDAGAIYVWNGGALAGAVGPNATLSVPGASESDTLTLCIPGFWVEDVTGDGAPDVVAGAPWANAGGLDRGATYVWSGSSGFSGAMAPTATLRDASGGQLGYPRLADVDGDGVRDVLVGPGSNAASFLWRGGTGLVGAPAPQAVLSGGIGGARFLLHDWSGDGLPEVLVMRRSLYLWSGGPALTGTAPPRATLTLADNPRNERLLDFTGDGVLDVLAWSWMAESERGVLWFWNGATLTGTRAPDVTLRVPGAQAGDALGR